MTACEQVIEIDIPDSPPKLVVNSMFSQDSMFLIHLSYSQSISQAGQPQNITNGTVYVLDNGLPADTLTHTVDGYYTSTTSYRPREGHAYALHASASGVKPIIATSEIPEIIPVSNYAVRDSALPYPGNDGVYFTGLEFDMADPSLLTDYFMVNITAFDTVAISPADTFVYKRTISVFSQDQILTGTSSLKGYIFSDAGFNGSQRRFHFYFMDKVWNGSPPDPLFLEFSHLSEDCYKYLVSYNDYLNALNNPFAEPARLHSNVTDGLGIFAGRSTTVVRIR